MRYQYQESRQWLPWKISCNLFSEWCVRCAMPLCQVQWHAWDHSEVNGNNSKQKANERYSCKTIYTKGNLLHRSEKTDGGNVSADLAWKRSSTNPKKEDVSETIAQVSSAEEDFDSRIILMKKKLNCDCITPLYTASSSLEFIQTLAVKSVPPSLNHPCYYRGLLWHLWIKIGKIIEVKYKCCSYLL